MMSLTIHFYEDGYFRIERPHGYSCQYQQSRLSSSSVHRLCAVVQAIQWRYTEVQQSEDAFYDMFESEAPDAIGRFASKDYLLYLLQGAIDERQIAHAGAHDAR